MLKSRLRALLTRSTSEPGEEGEASTHATRRRPYHSSSARAEPECGGGYEPGGGPAAADPPAGPANPAAAGPPSSAATTARAPASFYCPISMELMADPVIVATGHTYDRPCIERWLAQGHGTCPVTGARLRHLELTPNFALRDAVSEWAAGVGRAVPARPDGAPRTNAATLFKGAPPPAAALGAGAAPATAGRGNATAVVTPPAPVPAARSAPPPPLPSILHGHDEIVWAVEAPVDGGGPGAGPAGRLFSASADRTVRVWDVASRRCEAVLEGHARPVLCLAAAAAGGGPAGEEAAPPDPTSPADGLGGCAAGGALFSGSYDHTIRAWSLSRLARAATLTGHTDAVRALLLAPTTCASGGGRLYSASYDGTVRVWDPCTGACTAVLSGHTGPVRTLAAGAGGLIFSGSYDGSVRAWDARAPTAGGGGGGNGGGPACAAVLTGHASAVRALAASPSSTPGDGAALVFSGSDDATIRAWDVRGLRCVGTLAGHDDNVRVLAAGPAGRPGASPSAPSGRSLLFSGSWDRTIRAWRTDTLACERVLAGHAEAVLALAVGDGVLASGSYDASVRLWDLATLRPGHVCGGHGDAVRVLAARGRTVFSGSYDGSVGVWEAGPGGGGGGGGGGAGGGPDPAPGGRGSTALV